MNKMKRTVSLCAALLIALLMAGCKSAPQTTGPAPVSDPSMPPWVNEQPPEGEVWGIGMANNTQMDLRMTMADSRARQDIARQLQVLAEGMVSDYAREAGTIDNTTALQFQETVSRQLTQETLRGVVRNIMWTTPDNKTLWVRVKMNKAEAAKAVTEQTQKAIDNEAARYAEFKAMDALKMMDQQLEKNSTAPQPVLP